MEDGKHVILCVDDDPDIVMSLRIVLEANGYRVVSAATAEEGLRVYEACRPEVVIVDLIMEEVDAGLTFARELRAKNSGVPIFFLSSTGDYLHGSMDMSEIGVSGVFQKPIDLMVLLSVVAQTLAHRAAPPAAEHATR